MLRISLIESPVTGAVLHLEGQIAGAWTAELRDTCERVLAAGRPLTLDLGDVSLIDRQGFDLLDALSLRNVSLARCSPFQEEQLRQLAAAHAVRTRP